MLQQLTLKNMRRCKNVVRESLKQIEASVVMVIFKNWTVFHMMYADNGKAMTVNYFIAAGCHSQNIVINISNITICEMHTTRAPFFKTSSFKAFKTKVSKTWKYIEIK